MGVATHIYHCEGSAGCAGALDMLRGTGRPPGCGARGPTLTLTLPYMSGRARGRAGAQVLLLSVEPGFGGQTFQAGALGKAACLRARFPDLHIQMDGGIGSGGVAEQAAEHGVNIIVSGALGRDGIAKGAGKYGAGEVVLGVHGEQLPTTVSSALCQVRLALRHCTSALGMASISLCHGVLGTTLQTVLDARGRTDTAGWVGPLVLACLCWVYVCGALPLQAWCAKG